MFTTQQNPPRYGVRVAVVAALGAALALTGAPATVSVAVAQPSHANAFDVGACSAATDAAMNSAGINRPRMRHLPLPQ